MCSPRLMPYGGECLTQERRHLWAVWERDSAQGPWQLSLRLSPHSHTTQSLLTQLQSAPSHWPCTAAQGEWPRVRFGVLTL